MKLSETDARFWDIIGPFLYCEDNIVSWSFNKETNTIILSSLAEKTYVFLDFLNQILKKNKDIIKSAWKTGNNFDGKLEVD